MKYVVIGASAAGISGAKTLRELEEYEVDKSKGGNGVCN